MIARMLKVFVAANGRERDRLLEALRNLGAVHLAPVEHARAVPEAETVAALERTDRALQILTSAQAAARRRPEAAPPTLSAAQAVDETLNVERRSAEGKDRLAALHRQMEQLAPWGDVRLEQLEALRAANALPQFFAVPNKLLGEVKGDFVFALGPWPGRKTLVALIDRTGRTTVPAEAQAIAAPARDRPSIRAEAARIDAELKQAGAQLTALAGLLPAIRAERARLKQQADYAVAAKGGLATDELYAVQGWVPEELAPALADGLAAQGLQAALTTQPPADDEQPPTLLEYAWWNRPIKGLFQILGTVPGYREFDVSGAFMIALPIFAAMLISDGGYGLLYLLPPIIFYRWLTARSAGELAQLLIVIGALSVAWGIVTASFFGLDVHRWLAALPLVGELFQRGPLIVVGMNKPYPEAPDPMSLLMRIAITIGTIHLCLAHLWRARANWPRLKFLGNLGWATFLAGMYGVVKMFILNDAFEGTVFPWLLGVGAALAILFAEPSRNVLKMLGLGLASFPLSAIGAFGDTVSYLRLMAIGVAGSALAATFNQMAEGAASFLWLLAIPVFLGGHVLNTALSIVSLLAHGVRLNMLEFSNNLGMQWDGYTYEPFSRKPVEEA